MKLSKLYCNKKNFKEILFNDGVNIIIGRIENPENKDLNVHNLGKSLIVKIIDFVLLKSNSFLLDNIEIFNGYSFFLELKLNNGKYLTIKRTVGDTKISFKEHDQNNQNFIDETSWDHSDYTISSTKKNAKDLLQKYLNFDILKENNYRNFLTYFLRGQSDYEDPFKLSKFKGKDILWKPALFEMLGYSGNNLDKKYKIDIEIEDIEKEIKFIEKVHGVSVDDLDIYKTQLETLENSIENSEENIKSFDFFLSDNHISKELVDDIENDISRLNLVRYDLQSDIKNIKSALDHIQTYNYEDLYELYQETKIVFGDQIKKSYEELLAFNNKITSERKIKLNELLNKKNDNLIEIDKNLHQLNHRRIEMLSMLAVNKEFDKFTQKQREIIKIKDKIEALKTKIDAIDKIREKDNCKLKLINERISLIEKIEKNIEKGTTFSKKIKQTFSNYVNKLISLNGILSIKPLQTGNIEFICGVMNSQGDITKESDGHTYRKALCSCLDLALITEYADKSFFRFVFHDGSVDGDDGRIAIKYLELIKELSLSKNLQCIITMIDSVVPMKADGTKYNISDEEVILELNDNPDNSGLLFGFKF